MQHDARDVGGFAQGRVAHHVDVGEPGHAQGIAQSGAARAFEVEEKLKISVIRKAAEKRLYAGRRVFRVRAQAVGPAVLCRKGRLLLANEVGLNGEPVTVVVPICLVTLSNKERGSEQDPENRKTEQPTMVKGWRKHCQRTIAAEMEAYSVCNSTVI